MGFARLRYGDVVFCCLVVGVGQTNCFVYE